MKIPKEGPFRYAGTHLKKKDRKVSIKLAHLLLLFKTCSRRSRTGRDCLKTCNFWAATQLIIYTK